MAKILKVRYTVQSGSLPNGLSLDPDTGQIKGSVGFDSLGQGPVWASPASGSVGAYNENDTITGVSFATNTSKTPISYSIVAGTIPWGLVFSSLNGTLGGTIAPLKLRVNESASTSDGPRWVTSFGTLANYDEGGTSSINLSATPIGSRSINNYQVVEGALPWGLTLNLQSGVISGTTAALKSPGEYVDVPKLPVPSWTTAAGSLGIVDEYSAFTTSVLATPGPGRSMSKYNIRAGALPFGFKLDYRNGNITGTAAELKSPETVWIDPVNDPVISNLMVVQGSNATVVDGGSLGSYTKGQSVSIGFIANAVSGRTIRNYWITGTLPFGLKLNNATGVISGTIINNARTLSKTYTFTLYVADKGDSQYRLNVSSRVYSITVQ